MPQYALRSVRFPVNNRFRFLDRARCRSRAWLRPSPRPCCQMYPSSSQFRFRPTFPKAAFDALDDPTFGLRPKGPSDPLTLTALVASLLKAEAFSRSKSRSPVAA